MFGSHIGGPHVAAGTVQQDVDTAVGRKDVRQVLLEDAAVQDIGGEEHRLAAVRLDFGNEFLSDRRGPFQVQQDDLAALSGKILYDSGAKHPAGSRHDGHLAFDVKQVVHSVANIAEFLLNCKLCRTDLTK